MNTTATFTESGRYGGRWEAGWSPDTTAPDLPPIIVIHDPHDEPVYTTTALAAHAPGHGQLVVHPTPLATAPAYLAQDFIRAQGKHILPMHTEPPVWTTNTDASWRVAVAWTQVLGISHYIVCRAHRITDRHLEPLMALRERTRIRLTLVVSGELTPALATILSAVPHQIIDTPEATRQHLCVRHPCLTPIYPWWEQAPFPSAEDEHWFQLPRRPAQPKVRPTQHPGTGSRLGPTPQTPHPGSLQPILLPQADSDQQPSPHYAEIARRIYSRIPNPHCAAAVAIRVLTGYGIDQLPELTASGTRRAGVTLPGTLPAWAALLIQAASIHATLDSHVPPDSAPVMNREERLFALGPWGSDEIAHATETCRLIAAPSPKPAKPRRRKNR